MGVVITINDVNTYSGMLLPSILQSYNQGYYTTTSTTNTITGAPKTAQVLPSSVSYYACEGINPKCLCGTTLYNMVMSAVESTMVYAAFPYTKDIRLIVYEDLTGSVNFEYFYLKYNGSNRASKTWSSISGTWTGTVAVTLNPNDKQYSLQANFGGMNSSRHIHYSDNVCSPGSWKYVGKYTYVNFNPGIDGNTNNFNVSAVTYYGGKTFMAAREYLHRLKHVCIAVGYSSTPSASNAKTQNSGKTIYWGYNYASTCNGNCSCDCNYCNDCLYTY